MKKWAAVILALALLSCAALAEGSWYVEAGQALAARMQALAADEAYIGLMGSGNEELIDVKDAFVGTDLSRPTAAWFLALPERDEILSAIERYAEMSGTMDADAFAELSDAARDELVRRLPGSVASLLCGQAGVGWIALSSLINAGEAREAPEDFRPGYLLLEYPGNVAVLATFTQSLPGYVGVSASPVPADSLDRVRPALATARQLGLSLELEKIEVE